MSWIFPIPTSS
jgi:hypothetical protein